MALRGWLYRKLKRKRKKDVGYIVETKHEDIEKIMPESFLKQFYDLKGRYEKLIKDNQEAKKIIRKLQKTEDEELKQLAFEQERIIEKKKRENQFPIFFKTSKPLFLVSALSGNEFFRDIEGKVWKQWYGILLEKTQNGIGFRFLLTNPDDNKIVWLPKTPIPFDYFPYVFDGNLITDSKIGRIPVYITVDGDFAPPEFNVSGDELRNLKKIKGNELNEMIKIDLRTILRNADQDTKNAFFYLYYQLMNYMEQYSEMAKRYKVMLTEKMQSDIASEASSKGLEESISSLDMLTEKLGTVTSKFHPLISSEQEARLTAASMESVFMSMYNKLKEIKMMIETPSSIKDKARKDIIGELSLLIPQMESLLKAFRKEGGSSAASTE